LCPSLAPASDSDPLLSQAESFVLNVLREQTFCSTDLVIIRVRLSLPLSRSLLLSILSPSLSLPVPASFDSLSLSLSTLLSQLTLPQMICEAVSTRAARLASAGIAAIVDRMGAIGRVTVAVDGSLFQRYPHFESRMMLALDELFTHPDTGLVSHNIVFRRSTDGSGKGAGMIAAASLP
jgi:hexokinase